MSTFLSLSIAVLFALLLGTYIRSRKQHRPYPPGPKPKPIIGNVLDLPTKGMAPIYMEWGKKYNSGIIHATALGTHFVVVNNVKDAVELFERRATKYNDRPYFPITKLIGFDRNIGLYHYGEKWRYSRRICQQIFHKGAVKNYHGIISQKVHAMLDGLLKSPENYLRHNKMLSISIPMKTMYGYDLESIDDPLVITADRMASLSLQLFLPGATFINIFPILAYIPAWFPGASSHKVAAEVKRLTEVLIRVPVDWAKMRMREGTAVPSLLTDFLEKKNTIGASENEERAIEDVAFTVYGAASDTIASATGSFLYCMVLNPDIQEKAQKEIDRVIGRNRLPDFSDRPKMPYIEAIYREVLRFKPPSQMGLSHSLMEDDHYNGYFIPKDTMVLTNIWAMTHDEAIYPDPYAFKPERFFDKNGELDDNERVLAYGFGRRICVGKHVASATVWLTFASILATFDIRKAKDNSGQEIAITHGYEEHGFITHQLHFECTITPRSREHSQLIEEANTSSK